MSRFAAADTEWAARRVWEQESERALARVQDTVSFARAVNPHGATLMRAIVADEKPRVIRSDHTCSSVPSGTLSRRAGEQMDAVEYLLEGIVSHAAQSLGETLTGDRPDVLGQGEADRGRLGHTMRLPHFDSH
jgi:hypothetical protein